MIYHPVYGINNYVLIWGDWLSCDPLRGSHDSQSPPYMGWLAIMWPSQRVTWWSITPYKETLVPHLVATSIYLSQNYSYYIKSDRSPLISVMLLRFTGYQYSESMSRGTWNPSSFLRLPFLRLHTNMSRELGALALSSDTVFLRLHTNITRGTLFFVVYIPIFQVGQCVPSSTYHYVKGDLEL